MTLTISFYSRHRWFRSPDAGLNESSLDKFEHNQPPLRRGFFFAGLENGYSNGNKTGNGLLVDFYLTLHDCLILSLVPIQR